MTVTFSNESSAVCTLAYSPLEDVTITGVAVQGAPSWFLTTQVEMDMATFQANPTDVFTSFIAGFLAVPGSVGSMYFPLGYVVRKGESIFFSADGNVVVNVFLISAEI